jgi:hypothetical protein
VEFVFVLRAAEAGSVVVQASVTMEIAGQPPVLGAAMSERETIEISD